MQIVQSWGTDLQYKWWPIKNNSKRFIALDIVFVKYILIISPCVIAYFDQKVIHM